MERCGIWLPNCSGTVLFGRVLKNRKETPMTIGMIGKHCVVRTYSAGVHLGTLMHLNGTNVVLKDSRRLWRWKGAFTLSEVATKGVDKDGSRISCAVPMIDLTEAIELIPTSEEARATFDEIHE
jgi:hypothetical protein